MTATFVILGLAVIAFISNRLPIGLVALGVAVSLWATGVLTLNEAFAGFGDPTVIFIASLFVVSESLDATGVTVWAGSWVVSRAGESRRSLIVVIILFTAVTTALVSVNGAVAALIPMVVLIAARAHIPASQMLLPLAFAAHAGSLLTLTGSPVNVILSEFAEDATGRSFGFFEFALVGVPLVIGTILIVVFAGQKLLPVRAVAEIPSDLASHANVLATQYRVSEDLEFFSRDGGLVEVVLPPRSQFIGEHMFPGMSTAEGDLVVVAAQRGSRPLEGPTAVLRAGDSLLLSGSWENLEHHISTNAGILPVTEPKALRRAVPLGVGAKRALWIVAAMVVLLALGVVPPAIAGLLAVGALILTKVVSPPQAYAAISWTTIVLIAGMIPLSTAFMSTGAADMLAEGLLTLLKGGNPTAALLAVCVVTMFLGQLISNVATVLITAPVALALAEALSVSPTPFLMALAVAGAAAFLTPIATPANMMVMEPGGYRFGDYWKLGLPLLSFYLVVAVLLVPLIWSL